MTNLEQAKMTGFDGLTQYMGTPTIDAVLAANPPFTSARGVFDTNYTDAKNKASTTGTDNTGFSVAKENAKVAMSNMVSTFAGYAFVKWDADNLNKPDLQLQMHIHPSFYMDRSDSNAAKEAKAVRKVMNDNIGDLTGYVSAADITAIDLVISTFENTQGNSDAAHGAEPVETAAFKTAIHKTTLAMHKLPIMAKFLIGTADEEIYNKIVALSNIPTVNIHHTNIVVEVFKKNTTTAIKNGDVHYSKSTKPTITDLQGFYHLEHVKSGQGLLTVKAPGFIDAEMIVNIKRGHDNHFVVEMEIDNTPNPN